MVGNWYALARNVTHCHAYFAQRNLFVTLRAMPYFSWVLDTRMFAPSISLSTPHCDAEPILSYITIFIFYMHIKGGQPAITPFLDLKMACHEMSRISHDARNMRDIACQCVPITNHDLTYPRSIRKYLVTMRGSDVDMT